MTSDAVEAAWHFCAIGTSWTITTPSPLPADLAAQISQRIEDYDRVYSRFRPDSAVTALARDGGEIELSDAWPALSDVYRRLDRLTGGSVSPLVGTSLEQLGYDSRYTLRPLGAALPARPFTDLDTNGTRVTLREPAMLDVGAAGKGQLVDIVAGILAAAGVSTGTADAGGDIRRSGEAISVALEHPYRQDEAIGVVTLGDRNRAAIAGSASNRRAWGDGMHHIIDGLTGEPVRAIVASWALASTALVADAAATALFFASGAEVAEEFEVDWVRVFADGHIEYAAALREGIFTS